MNLRTIAYTVLIGVEKEEYFAREALDKQYSENALQQKDRSFLKELVYGCIRRRGTIDWVLRSLSTSKKVPRDITTRVILRVGIYQLGYMDRVPEHAAVHETVSAAKQVLPPGKIKFINALLREWIRRRKTVRFPYKESDEAGFLSVYYSFPRALVRRWIKRFGYEETERLLATGNELSLLVARVNTEKITRTSFLEKLSGSMIQAEPSRFHPLGVVITSRVPVISLPGFNEGLFQIQDEQAMHVVDVLDPQPGETVIDLCSAPGGKTTYIGQKMRRNGTLYAVDVSEDKISFIKENLQRLDMDWITVLQKDGRFIHDVIPKGSADRVLVDAPCSNTGVFRRRVEARWRFSVEHVKKYTQLQSQLLDAAAEVVKENGVLVYSTCSIEKEENELIIDNFCYKHPEFRVEEQKMSLPEAQGPDGGYWAKLVKNE